MSRDLLLGRTRRNWAAGLDVEPKPALDADSRLAALIVSPRPTKPSRSAETLVKDALREQTPEVMALYDKYRPTYRNQQVILRMKTDLLKGMLGYWAETRRHPDA